MAEGTDSYLSVRGFANMVVSRVIRARMGIKRGGLHIYRRRAVIDTKPLARRYPEAFQRLLRMTMRTAELYFVTGDYEPAHLFPASRTAAQILEGAPRRLPANARRPHAIASSREPQRIPTRSVVRRPSKVRRFDIREAANER